MPRLLLIGLALTGILAAIPPSSASPQSAKKSSKRSQPVPPLRAAPDTTATIPQTAKAAAPAVDKEDETVPAPFNLPTASRSRMRACGESWQAMKMSGEAASETWRAYATKCLASKEGPAKPAPR